jgi:hypothetical protein
MSDGYYVELFLINVAVNGLIHIIKVLAFFFALD